MPKTFNLGYDMQVKPYESSGIGESNEKGRDRKASFQF